MRFADRADAGRSLTEQLRHLRRKEDRMSPRMRRRLGRVAVGRVAAAGVVVGAAAALLRTRRGVRAAVSEQYGRARRQVRRIAGRLAGLAYHIRGGHPDPHVPDDVLADRVRSSLGPLLKRLDLPRIHVMAERHVVLLHGEVSSAREAAQLISAVQSVAGVAGVESYLHVGLLPGDSRPSAGRFARPSSEARRRLVAVAVEAGIDPSTAIHVVRAVLSTFADRLPADEREQVAAHLPEDVRYLFAAPWRVGQAPQPRTVAQLVARIAARRSELPVEAAGAATAAVLRELRALVPEEVADVAAVLPAELRDLWDGKVTGGGEQAGSPHAPPRRRRRRRRSGLHRPPAPSGRPAEGGRAQGPLDEEDVEAAIGGAEAGPAAEPELEGGAGLGGDESFAFEELAAELEPPPLALEEQLHVEDALSQAILDEGVALEGFDPEEVELAVVEEEDEDVPGSPQNRPSQNRPSRNRP